jgi:uncharacterized protein (DUF2249 family)
MKTENGISIDANTRIKVLLDADQVHVIDVLVRLNKNFSKLRSPILRNLLGRRVTIAEACKIAGCQIRDFLNVMQQIGFTVSAEGNKRAQVVKTQASAVNNIYKPGQEAGDRIDFTRGTTVFELDVRPYLEQDMDPLKVILNYVRKLARGERLRLVNKFEPTPLINLLKEQGFLYFVEVLQNDMIVTWFEKTDDKYNAIFKGEDKREKSEQESFDVLKNSYPADKIKYIDVRYLEMPNPMLLIMENIEQLKSGELIYVYHKKVPLFLLPELDRMGLTHLFNHQAATGIDMLICRS